MWFNKIRCFMGKHKFYKIFPYGINCFKLGCQNCPKEFGYNASINILLYWDNDMEEFYKFTKTWTTL